MTVQPPNDGSQPIAVSYSHHDGQDAIAFWYRIRPGEDMTPIFLTSDAALTLTAGLREAVGGETDPRVVNDGDWPRLEVGFDPDETSVAVYLQLRAGGPIGLILIEDAAAYALADTVIRIVADRDRDPRRIDEVARQHPEDFA